MKKRKPSRPKPDPETAAILARACAGEWLTHAETTEILRFNCDYVFRYFRGPVEPEEHRRRVAQGTLATSLEDIEASLRDEGPRWRMLGRSQPIVHKDESFMLLSWKDGEGFYWAVSLEGETLVDGHERTAEEAARAGGDAFAWEHFVRAPTEPIDYRARHRAIERGEAPPCDVCGDKLSESYCDECQHTFCETTGTCPKQPSGSRGSCMFCGAPNRVVVPEPCMTDLGHCEEHPPPSV